MRVKYNYYLKINNYDKSVNIIFKYLRRYYINIFNKKISEFQRIVRKKSVSKAQPLYDYEKGMKKLKQNE